MLTLPQNVQIRQPDPDYDSGDEGTAHISARSLALVRFKRNHALMNEVFNNAANRASCAAAPQPVVDSSQWTLRRRRRGSIRLAALQLKALPRQQPSWSGRSRPSRRGRTHEKRGAASSRRRP